MFDIEFIADRAELQEDGWLGLWGRITLGDYNERFLAPIGHWTRENYERQWLEAARRLLHESDRTAFFTAAYQFWWAMWREGETVFVQEEFIAPGRYSGPYDQRAPYDIIKDRQTHTEDGELVSEWEIRMEDIRAFVERRDGTEFPA